MFKKIIIMILILILLNSTITIHNLPFNNFYDFEYLSKTNEKLFNNQNSDFQYEEIKQYIKKAKSISPDIGDVPYFALALKYKIPIWSNDKDLKKKQDRVKIYKQ